MSTFTSSTAFKVGSTKNLALGLLGYYRSIKEALSCIKENISDSGSWAAELESDGGDGTYNYYDLVDVALTAATNVVTDAVAYVNQTTTANEATLRTALNTDIGTFNTAFNNVLELFSDGIITGGTPAWNTAAWGDNETNTGLLMNMTYEDQLVHKHNMNVLSESFSVALTSLTINLGNVDRTSGTVLTTLNVTNYDALVAAVYSLNCKFVGANDDLEALIANQKIHGTLMLTTPSSTYLSATIAIQTAWATADAAVDSIITTLS